MKQIVVAQDVAYAAKAGGGTITSYKDVDTLATGAVAFFTEKNVLITSSNANTVLPDVKKFYIAVGNQQAITNPLDDQGSQASVLAKSYVTGLIPRSPINFKFVGYVNPVNQVKFIGSDGSNGAFNQPSTLVAGTEAIIRLTKTTTGLRTVGSTYENEVKRYNTVVLAGDTITTIANRLIAQINADPDSFVVAVAVGSTTGIQLTTVNNFDTFAISVDGILISASRWEAENTAAPGNATAIVYGEGTDWEIAMLEDLYSVENGNTNRAYFANYYYKKPSLVVTGTKYSKYVISFRKERDISTGHQFTATCETLVAIPRNGTEAADVQTIFDSLFDEIANSTPEETGS